MNDVTYDRTNYMDNDHRQDLRNVDMKHFSTKYKQILLSAVRKNMKKKKCNETHESNHGPYTLNQGNFLK